MIAFERQRVETLDFFDDLVERQVSIDELLVNAAAFANTTVGIILPDATQRSSRRTDDALRPNPPEHATRLQNAHGQIVWLDDADKRYEDAGFFLRRFALAAQMLSQEPPPRDFSRVPPLEILIRTGTSEPLLLESLKRLRVRPDETIRVQICEGNLDKWSAFIASQTHRRLVARASLQTLNVTLWVVEPDETYTPIAPPAEVVAAESEIYQARNVSLAFENARSALRFASIASLTVEQKGTLVRHEDLGPFASLASLNRAAIDAVSDVQRLDELVQKHGPVVLTVLEAYASSESQRKAAVRLHLHHNSISYWVKRAERSLEFDVGAVAQRSRLLLSVILYRLRDTAATTRASSTGADIRL
ncbi:hypothetical protein DC31_06800 [Microbacterium sp. CH12i]|uniref:helix-turn-helix domain-containing protein n=1 Tax=Microbacterium sp. CH12i TaxID=1479651 RepID=UPI000462017E|nr:helix-turn-helix domain-containing protein [Microbacterium sp. CH12i]KDA06907.1 hypothetical protein DC31_06800 [Microbacterium sp. CH12i]